LPSAKFGRDQEQALKGALAQTGFPLSGSTGRLSWFRVALPKFFGAAPWNTPRHRQRRAIAEPHEKAGARYIRSTERARLLSSIVKARGWLRRLVSGEATALVDIAKGQGHPSAQPG